ncbi:MAG: PAS domain-containing protein, partial [Bdellovibrionales bacterium]|nr:PAS domain-containing protein [Bdellovibrionales bacterium]
MALKRFKSENGSSGQAGIVTTLSERAKLFIFAYSPTIRSLITWSDNALDILGVKDVDIARDGNLFLRHVHPDDRFLLMTDLETALKGEKDYRATYRWIRPDNNEVRWLHCRAGMVKRPEGNVFEGILLDLSEEFTGEVSRIAGPDSVQTILSAFPALVFTVDRDKRLLRINRKKDEQQFNFGDTGFRFEQFRIGRPILSAFSDD